MSKYEIPINIVNEIKEAWNLVVGKNKKLKMEDLKVMMNVIGIRMKQEEHNRIIKEKGDNPITIEEFFDIIKVKLKLFDSNKFLAETINAFKNKNTIFLRSQIEFGNQGLGQFTERSEVYDETAEFGVDDIIDFCENMNIPYDREEMEETISELNKQSGIYTAIDSNITIDKLRYLYKKTNFI